jgi:hypothetical protein
VILIGEHANASGNARECRRDDLCDKYLVGLWEAHTNIMCIYLCDKHLVGLWKAYTKVLPHDYNVFKGL